ncbi:phosphoglycolate phosphatase [Ramlibacter monticola]|uniref:phosphoglycolate phosphatase n=1 Tax=Ramlibacter monticola TaxID=1926872 RepID=A0A937CXC1_9BURK|nr:phosphoglycolate phosphatase [Ramlibacter monticola]MBL0395014.1 phosphoglycolate phosphatase [Ramlibacter monticola]
MFEDVKAVLFDLDGTLIDSAPDLGAAANKMRADRGLPSLPFERYRPMAGAGARGMLGVAFGMTPEDPHFAEMREEFFRNYESCMTQRTYVFEGVAQMIASLVEQGVAWGVVTNKSMRFTGPLTRKMPLFASARAVVGGDSTPHAKPHPAPLLEAARQVGVQARACVYVGDDVRDVQAGRAAGMGTVAATYGYLGTTDVKEWGADTQIATPMALLPLLRFRMAA